MNEKITNNDILKLALRSGEHDKESLLVLLDNPAKRKEFIEQNGKELLATRKKPGRKPIPKNRRRETRIMIRVNDAEFREIVKAINNQELAEAVRELALESARRRNNH